MSHDFGFEEKSGRNIGILTKKPLGIRPSSEKIICGKLTTLPDVMIDEIISYSGLKTLVELNKVNNHLRKRTNPFKVWVSN